ncbi:AmmeMemoRadiSam system protein A [Pseudothauera rhizosphaerae]|uniref:AmmeMemoRadiSam system protein A n=1 Tax=Pseudothauera rhizosphaerae TaxID=2565932 RepID=A0A4S4AVC0_9RHOO|nr:AmmeMemoRadiSam system protein A [Pseudothauera rhizosphaerae]THF63490.1 AmmeMemoRadiSam system protein A [Pseudothauera rhizosphaerae]
MPQPPDTDDALGAVLLARARTAIARELGAAAPALPDDPALEQRGATFVTLKKHGELRGCIGSLRAQRPLGEDVAANAVAAATRDPRFPPLMAKELAEVDIEVSLLSEPEFLDFADEDDLLAQLRPFEDGLILFAGCRSATFLPQVWEQLPEPRRFLAALKQKGGLPPDYPVSQLMAARYHVRKWHEKNR